jgi:iron complex outermembrane receptor protein
VVGGTSGFIASPNSPQSAKWNKLTYRIILDHHFTAALMGYAGYNVGFKSGIFNTVINPLTSIGSPVRPETLIAYTAGEKAEFLNRRIEANAEFFYYQDRNIQVNEINGPATLITNAASATFKGVDLDIAAVLIERLTVSASLEALRGRYGSLPDGQYWVYQPMTGGNCPFGPPNYCGLTVGAPGTAPGFNGTTWNLEGNRTVDSPPYSVAVTASYLISTPAGGITTTLNWSHTGDYFADADSGLGQIAPSSPGNDRQGIINLLNASIMWTSEDGHWTVSLWGKNLTEQKYWSYAEEDTFTTQYSAAAPRTYGLNLGIRR